MPAPDTIFKLVERFESNIDQYRSPRYNEAQLRTEFANPFFIALGWDVFNEKGYAEAYKEVVHEAVVKVGGATKAPDYSFRIGGTRKFFVETKKPAVNLSVDPLPAFQLRRYAWSAKLPLSILTDFEEFAVYDTRIKPAKNDKASLGRIINLTFRDYTDRWEEIADIFSPTAIRKGSFDKYVESTRKKKGTAEVDDAFLKDIESWRDELARNIALRNPGLSTRELNFAVQRIIDRIIFLRICEDRGIEEYGELQSLLKEADIYSRLVTLFHRADERYNSGLFHFNRERGRPQKPDTLTPTLKIDDRVPKEIIKDLYYPESPYEFSVLPADILGQVYEQFLGKVIRLTPGHRAVVEEKPEVKKAGGVYYTPTYIVDYIVENTVGKLLEGKTPRQVSKLRILDPACGSGSFLIGAYQKLLDWHQEWYFKDGPEKHRKELYPAFGGGSEWRLTTAERRRILLNNIYGVDIDPQAVEVTKLSLLLKVLEGESGETLNRQLEIFRERALPDLATNIKCGNSLIGPDFYEGKQMSLLSDEERLRINPFDWDAEFAEIMEPRPAIGGGGGGGFAPPKAGFDAVIGNPPYVAKEIDKNEKSYIKDKYSEIIKGRPNLYALFIYRSLNLLGFGGLFGYINPKTYLADNYFSGLRQYLLDNYCIKEILNVEDRRSVFKNVLQSVNILIIRRSESDTSKTLMTSVDKGKEIEHGKILKLEVPQRLITTNIGGLNVILHDTNIETYNIFEKLSLFDRFNEVGVNAQTGKIQWDLYKKQIKEKRSQGTIRLIWAENIQRYFFEKSKKRKDKEWILAKNIREANKTIKIGEIIVTQRVTAVEQPRRIIATIIDNKMFSECAFENHTNTIFVSKPYKNEYILGILNSQFFDFVFRKISSNTQVSSGQLNNLPIRTIDFDDPEDVERHDRMVALVEDMLALHKKLAGAKTPHTQKSLKRQIDATDSQIDKLVYELYGLSDEEIRVVEGELC